jgi:hypothetical protein
MHMIAQAAGGSGSNTNLDIHRRDAENAENNTQRKQI